jgi:hypothetical protein
MASRRKMREWKKKRRRKIQGRRTEKALQK